MRVSAMKTAALASSAAALLAVAACGVPGFSQSSPSPSPVPSADVTVAYDAEGVAGRKIEISVAKHSCALIGSPFYYENDYNR